MTVKTRKTSSRGKKVQTIFKVTAAYVVKFRTASEAKAAVSKISANTRAVVGSIKKSGSIFTLPVKFVYYVESAANKAAAIKTAKAHGARVTVSTVKR